MASKLAWHSFASDSFRSCVVPDSHPRKVNHMSLRIARFLLLALATFPCEASAIEAVSFEWNHAVESKIHVGESSVRCDASGPSPWRDPKATESPSEPLSGPDTVCGVAVTSKGTIPEVDFATGAIIRTRAGADTGPGTAGLAADGRIDFHTIQQPDIWGVGVRIGVGHRIRNGRVFPISTSLLVDNTFVFDTSTDIDTTNRNVTLGISTRTSNGRLQPYANDALSGTVSVFDDDTDELLYSLDVSLPEFSSETFSESIPFSERMGHQVRVEFDAMGESLMVSPQNNTSPSAGISFRVGILLPEPSSAGLFSPTLLGLLFIRRRRGSEEKHVANQSGAGYSHRPAS